MMKSLCGPAVCLALIFAVLTGSGMRAEAAALPIIKAQNQKFVDAAGRQVVLRGVNAGGRSKLPPFLPFEPVPDFSTALDRYVDAIAALGFNVVRLLVIYEAAEPVRGRYDEKYLAQYDRMVQAFAARGIYVIVDSHQDLFSRRFCGDGFPDWVVEEKYRDLPQRSSCKIWNLHYFTSPVLNSFDRLWSNSDGIQDSVAAFFKMLAERYQDEPAVLGFEPINEPMPGGRGYLDYSGFHAELYAFYEKVGDAVHSVAPRYIIFADICALENTGTINPDRERPRVDNLALAPHYYDLGTFGVSLAPGGDQWLMDKGISRHRRLASSWQVPVLLTEYGITPLSKDAPAYINKLFAVFDEHALSGTFWEASMSATIVNYENTSLFEPDGTLRPRSVFLDRPYPRAVAGDIESFSFDPESALFELTWNESEAISSPTEIHLPARLYQQGTKIYLDPPGEFDFDVSAAVIKIFPLSKTIRRQARISPN